MSGTGVVGVGVIGAGVISTQYLANLTRFPDLAVLFIADLNTTLAAEQAELFGVPRSGTVEELLADPAIEIVVNLTIPAAHVPVALRAVAAGKSVWSEKPFSLDRASGRELLAAAAAAGVRVACAPDTILGAGLQSSRRLIEDGAIGTPLTASVVLQNGGPESWHPNPEFYFSAGGGPLFDMGPYYLTALVQNLGPVARVSAVSSVSRPTRVIGSGPKAGVEIPVNVPTYISALIEFERGASAQAVFSFDAHMERHGVVEINGTDGAVSLPDPNTFTGDIRLYTNGGEPTIVKSEGSTFARGTGVVELAQAIRAGRPERAPGELAFHIVDVMISISEAAERGMPVVVESTVEVAPPLPASWDPSAATLAG